MLIGSSPSSFLSSLVVLHERVAAGIIEVLILIVAMSERTVPPLGRASRPATAVMAEGYRKAQAVLHIESLHSIVQLSPPVTTSDDRSHCAGRHCHSRADCCALLSSIMASQMVNSHTNAAPAVAVPANAVALVAVRVCAAKGIMVRCSGMVRRGLRCEGAAPTPIV